METNRNDRRGIRLILALLLTTTVAAWAYPPSSARGDGPAAGAFAQARGALPPKFREYRTGTFVILSDGDPSWTRERGAMLERTRHQFQRVMSRLGIPLSEPTEPLVCVLFRSHEEFRMFAGMLDGVEPRWVSGYYATDANRIVFYDDSSSPDVIEAFGLLDRYEAEAARTFTTAADARRDGREEHADRLEASAQRLSRQIVEERRRVRRHATDSATAKTIHEAVHLLSFNMGAQSVLRDSPFWLSEGLATSFETSDPRAAFGPEHANPGRERAFAARVARDELIPLRDFVVMREAQTHDGAAVEGMYAQAHVLFCTLYRYEREALARYMLALKDGPTGRRSPEEQRSLFESHFGPCERLERRILQLTAQQ